MRPRIGTRQRALVYALLGNAFPISIAVAVGYDSHGALFLAGAAGGCVAPVVVTLVPRRRRIPFYLGAFGGIPALTLMQADSGGVASGYSLLPMMAMVWFGLRATDRELVAGLGVLAACAYLPMLVVGPPAYPVNWGFATILVLIGSTVAGSLRSVTRQTTRLTQRLQQQAMNDDLTGLLNRRGWRDAAQRELAIATRTGRPVALVAIDLDDLKGINDSMGHDEGDRLLLETADRLRTALRAGDVVARLGGDEFAALLVDATLDRALAVVERLRKVTPKLGAFSAGVAARGRDEDLDEMVRRADAALYASKSPGGRGVEVASQGLEATPDPRGVTSDPGAGRGSLG